MARVHGIDRTGVRVSETVEKKLGIAAKRLMTVERTIATAEANGKTAARIIRIAGVVGVPTERITRIAGGVGVSTERISRVIGEFGNITAEVFRANGDCGVITKEISEPLAKFDRTTNELILQGQVTGINPWPNISGMDIPAGITKGEAGEEPTDAKLP